VTLGTKGVKQAPKKVYKKVISDLFYDLYDFNTPTYVTENKLDYTKVCADTENAKLELETFMNVDDICIVYEFCLKDPKLCDSTGLIDIDIMCDPATEFNTHVVTAV